MTADPLAFLRATHAAAQAEAEEASTETGSPLWRGTTDGLYSDDASNHPGPFLADSYGYNPPEIVTHIARHDPAAVLRRIAADRKLIAAHPITSDVRDIRITRFGCETCHRRDDRIDGRGYCDSIVALAEGWGWTEETT